MPRRTRAAAKPLTIGIAGSGELAVKAIAPMLDDLTEGRTVEALYVPVTDADYTDEVAAVVKWAVDNDVAYTTISDEAAGKDKELKKVIAGGADDYDAGDSAGKAIVELLAGDETEPVEDGRLLLFLDGEEDDDVAIFEEAADLEVPAFDLCNGLEAIKFGDEEDDAPAAEEEEKDEEPEEAPVGPTRRRKAKAAAEEAEAEEDDDEAPAKEPLHVVNDTEEELLKLTLVELKKKAKALDPKKHTTDSLRGLGKPDVVALLLGEEEEGEDADESGDEAQTDLPSPATASEAVETPTAAEEGDPEAETREAVFARLRANRERAEAISINLTRSLKAIAEEGTAEEAVERASAALASSLMLFAEYIIVEVRKPKSPGRPRKDGTEAQPKQAAAEEAPKARRGRRSAG